MLQSALNPLTFSVIAGCGKIRFRLSRLGNPLKVMAVFEPVYCKLVKAFKLFPLITALFGK